MTKMMEQLCMNCQHCQFNYYDSGKAFCLKERQYIFHPEDDSCSKFTEKDYGRSNPKCFISTGAKSVMHTLWFKNTIKPDPTAPPEKQRGGFVMQYVRTLAKEKDKAVKKAKEYAMGRGIKYAGIMNSPMFHRADHFEAFGIDWKHKRKDGKSYYYGIATEEFWEAWRKNKEGMKEYGFSVSKYRDQRQLGYNRVVEVWYVFFKPQYFKEEI